VGHGRYEIMPLTDTLDEVFYIIFGVIEEAYWPIIGVFIIVALVGVILSGANNAKSK